ncbi:MarR family transcriptional regulator [Nocardia sp. CDC159]|uniref:MarR family transcriptional regulator n=1 Tax=Nocardia pulmonis TaxID=2951408 RepID=A0A9X2IW36_9NOCA|nr:MULTISPECIES: MarR family transcriptional regulator [Nocardia]MCM6772435.1 MarR family transcriptional regulator [Nocardia pulmonis]MCM6784907.1 MarR family transcriptional regulator [Nocardia sp. CDC159]
MSSDSVPVAAAVGEAVARYQAAVDDFDREVARLLRVNETDLRCLEILIRDVPEEATPRLLADRLGLTTGSVTTMLDRLGKLGYITRSPHPTDRRRLIVRATEAAAADVFALIGPLVEEGQRELLTRYSRGEVEVIVDFLTRAGDLQLAHVRRLRDLERPARG